MSKRKYFMSRNLCRAIVAEKNPMAQVEDQILSRFSWLALYAPRATSIGKMLLAYQATKRIYIRGVTMWFQDGTKHRHLIRRNVMSASTTGILLQIKSFEVLK
jgi:hypothetical protein